MQAITLNGTQCRLKDECATNNGGCAQVCTDKPDGFQCSCFPKPRGFRDEVWLLSPNKYDCLDVDECAKPAFVDEQCPSPAKCVNSPGFFACIRNTAISKSGLVASGEYFLKKYK